jgi:two-component system, sensor histidine kinase and response regulator
VKFTERGEVVVTVHLEEYLTNRAKLKFEVRDSGIGMTPEQSARLFQAFSQADSSVTRKYGGTGLGLSISKRLVEMMEGNIWVESAYGQGTTFWFTAWFGIGSAEKLVRKTPPGLADIRALVVDDNAVAREILAEVLKRFLKRVNYVSSGEEAIAELIKADQQDDPYRLVLMDWHMPGFDGLETSRMIKQPDRLQNIPKIVVITAFGREEAGQQAEEAGVEGVLQKPVTPSVLFDTLIQIFGIPEETHSSVHTARDMPSPDTSGVRILVVEDNDVNQQVATELLEGSGAKVTVANNGREAVEILTHGDEPPFDIVLMDLQMPVMDGLAATKLLRAQPHLQKLPIIAMTAHAMAEEVHRCLEAGMNDHVAKPVDPDTLFATLMRWIPSRKRSLREVPSGRVRTESVLIPLQIEGVDVSGGLNRVSGNARLYRDLLERFVGKQSSAATEINAALEKGDHALAEQKAHSLKGVAGNLGIDGIFHSAGKVETAIRDSHGDLAALIKELSFLLRRQIEMIERALSVANSPSKSASAATDPSATRAAFDELRTLLEANDADTPRAYAVLRDNLNGTVEAAQLEDLGAAVHEFDFDRALFQLQEISKQYEANREK